jgi:hypothetical protein
MPDGRGSLIIGAIICWLLNTAELGIGWLLLVHDDRYLPMVYVLIGAIGLVQVGYVVPLWRLLVRKGKPHAAKGLLIAAGTTALVNILAVAALAVRQR